MFRSFHRIPDEDEEKKGKASGLSLFVITYLLSSVVFGYVATFEEANPEFLRSSTTIMSAHGDIVFDFLWQTVTR